MKQSDGLGEIGRVFQRFEMLREDAERLTTREPFFEVAIDAVRKEIGISSSERAEPLLKMADEIERCMVRYIQSVTRFLHINERVALDRTDQAQLDRLQGAEFARTRAHTALIDTINALLRNCLQDGIEAVRPIAEQFSGHSDDKDHRANIAEAVLVSLYRQATGFSRETEDLL